MVFLMKTWLPWRVLILVIMEWDGNTASGVAAGIKNFVLILVIMEWDGNWLRAPTKRSKKLVLILVIMEWDGNDNAVHEGEKYNACLNPCYNGMRWESAVNGKFENGWTVLILVIMEWDGNEPSPLQ